MIIKNAKFVISNSDHTKCPTTGLPEYAFIGRSNVGKSSLINALTGQKKLAMTSATPGKTLLINHFLVNGEWYLVDLPGYGYAKRSKTQTHKLYQIIEGYILNRATLTNLFVLIDSRLSPQAIDLDFINWLGSSGIPFSIVFTKADKSKTGDLRKNIDTFLDTLAQEWEELPPHFVTSSKTQAGRNELLDYIDGINKAMPA